MSRGDDVVQLAPIRRLGSLAKLDGSAVSLLEEACANGMDIAAARSVPLHHYHQPILIVSGWAARVRIVAKGVAVMADLALPGEIVRPIDSETFKLCAINQLRVTSAPDASTSLPLQRAYVRSYHLTESYLLAHVARMALMSAAQRLEDFIGEMLERTLLTSEHDDETFQLPLNQRHLGEALGMTPVHVNRTLRILREREVLRVQRGTVQILAKSMIGARARRNVEAIRTGGRFPQRSPLIV